MIKQIFVLLCCCFTCTSVDADDVQKRVYELDSFKTPVEVKVVESLVESRNVKYIFEIDALELNAKPLMEPGQIFESRAIPFTPVVDKIEKAETEKSEKEIDPKRIFPSPRPELLWMITEDFRQRLSEDQRKFQADQRKAESLIYGGALILERIDKERL